MSTPGYLRRGADVWERARAEAQHYLDMGERVAATLHRLLTDPSRGPVLVLATLWPEHDRRYAARPGWG
jgi:hypothetical protein